MHFRWTGSFFKLLILIDLGSRFPSNLIFLDFVRVPIKQIISLLCTTKARFDNYLKRTDKNTWQLEFSVRIVEFGFSAQIAISCRMCTVFELIQCKRPQFPSNFRFLDFC